MWYPSPRPIRTSTERRQRQGEEPSFDARFQSFFFGVSPRHQAACSAFPTSSRWFNCWPRCLDIGPSRLADPVGNTRTSAPLCNKRNSWRSPRPVCLLPALAMRGLETSGSWRAKLSCRRKKAARSFSQPRGFLSGHPHPPQGGRFPRQQRATNETVNTAIVSLPHTHRTHWMGHVCSASCGT